MMRKAALVAALITVFSVPAAPALAVPGTGTAATGPAVTALVPTDRQPVPVAISQRMTTIAVHVTTDRAGDCVRLFGNRPRRQLGTGCSRTRDVVVKGTVPSSLVVPGNDTWTLAESNGHVASLRVTVFQRADLRLAMTAAARQFYVVTGVATYYDRFLGTRPYPGTIHLQEFIAGKWVTVRSIPANRAGLFAARVNHARGPVTFRVTRPQRLPMGGASSVAVTLHVR